MDREVRIAKITYAAITVFLTTAMLIGSIYLHSMPEKFFM